MTNAVSRKQLNLVWHYPCGREKKYGSRVGNWSLPPYFPAVSVWQMTLLSLSWVAGVGCFCSEDIRFMWYCFNDSPETSVAKLRQRHPKQREQRCKLPHRRHSPVVTTSLCPVVVLMKTPVIWWYFASFLWYTKKDLWYFCSSHCTVCLLQFFVQFFRFNGSF